MNLFLKRFKRSFIFKDRIKMTPVVFLSLFLIFTMTLLTGMCTIFPKKKVLIYDGEEKIGYIHLNNEENLNFNVNEYLKTIGKSIKQNDITKIEKLGNGNYEFKINRDVAKQDDNFETKIEDVKFELIDLPEEQVEDLNLEQDKTVVLKSSIPRKIKKYVECKYLNGELVEKKQKEEIVEEGVARKISIGKKDINNKQQEKAEQEKAKQEKAKQEKAKQEKAKQEKANSQKKDTPQANQNLSGKKVLCGYSTAYVAKGRTSRMGPARVGVVAVNPKVIPYGTKLFIEGYGNCVAGDLCGAACKGKVLVDVCLKTNAECKAWGRKKVKVYIL